MERIDKLLNEVAEIVAKKSMEDQLKRSLPRKNAGKAGRLLSGNKTPGIKGAKRSGKMLILYENLRNWNVWSIKRFLVPPWIYCVPPLSTKLWDRIKRLTPFWESWRHLIRSMSSFTDRPVSAKLPLLVWHWRLQRRWKHLLSVMMHPLLKSMGLLCDGIPGNDKSSFGVGS